MKKQAGHQFCRFFEVFSSTFGSLSFLLDMALVLYAVCLACGRADDP